MFQPRMCYRRFVPARALQVFDILRRYYNQGAAMAAYTKGNSDKENIDGIVCGHAYSVMEIRKPAGIMMLRLRVMRNTRSLSYRETRSVPVCRHRKNRRRRRRRRRRKRSEFAGHYALPCTLPPYT
mmetsp:Transcript_64557/g.179130  ORF Transcript_64557/g.179130 Transcript_64557/m.179130 type:complete len:126 (-) Transcript_64557:816-1193(-)